MLTSSADAVVHRTHRVRPLARSGPCRFTQGSFRMSHYPPFTLYFYSLLYTLLFYFSFLPSYIYCCLTPIHARNEGQPHADGEEITDQYVQWYATAAENAVLQVGFNSMYYYFFLYGRHCSRMTMRPHCRPCRQCRTLMATTATPVVPALPNTTKMTTIPSTMTTTTTTAATALPISEACFCAT